MYFWADGIHVNVRLDAERSCILVIVGADEYGRKELVAVSDRYGESTKSWQEMLLDLRSSSVRLGRRGIRWPSSACARMRGHCSASTGFPAEHWTHVRTTNPTEWTCATIRLRTRRTKGCGSRTASLTMVWKLALEAEKTRRRLIGFN